VTPAHIQTDDERRNDLLQVIKLYDAMSDSDRYAEHYDHVSHGCPIDQDTNDGQHRLLPDGVGCPLCKDDPSPFDEPAAFFGGIQ
jgi:hypothetical protein